MISECHPQTKTPHLIMGNHGQAVPRRLMNALTNDDWSQKLLGFS